MYSKKCKICKKIVHMKKTAQGGRRMTKRVGRSQDPDANMLSKIVLAACTDQ